MHIKGLFLLPLLALACQASIFPSRADAKVEDTVTISSEIPIPTSTVHNVATVTETVRDVHTVTQNIIETAAPSVYTYEIKENEDPRLISANDILLSRVVVDVLTANGTLVDVHPSNSASSSKANFALSVVFLVAGALMS